MKNKYIKSAVSLTLICLVVSVLLAVTNVFTEPRIMALNEQKVKSACFEVFPGAEDFEELSVDAYEGIPASIKSIFRETGGKGCVFTAEVKGYNPGLVIVCGIDSDGKITDIKITSCNETETIGGRVKKKEYTDKYAGKSSVEQVDGAFISGATRTTKAFVGAIEDIFNAYSAVIGNGGEKA